uniref:Neuroguidin n=1 Tax=Anthurium amnicola TaxID=1678845 RepID=A0A1D1YIN7_9ARAE
MEEREAAETAAPGEETLTRDAPRLVALLKEMKKALDLVRGKVEVLTSKVKENQYPTGDGISYLEAKHLLLLSYCQSIVYYVLRKAKGLSIEGHPVVRSLVEIRLFLEKIRPIDKKHDYQIQKLMRAANNAVTNSVGSDEGVKEASQGAEDPLKYRPNPDMLVSKVGQAAEDGAGVYRPPRFAPTSMDEDNASRKEKLAMRRERETLFRAKQSALAKELIDEIEGRPEEVREVIGTESQEVTRYKAKREERERQEEELFTRAPFTKLDKKMEKHLRKSRNGLLDLSDIYDDVRALPLGKNDDSNETNYRNFGQGGKRFKKRKRRQ